LDKIFATTGSNDSLDPAQLPILAKSVGVDEIAFNTCLSSGKYTQAVKDSATEGFNAGARGTPYSVILVNGKVKDTINGAEPLLNVKAKIDALLK
jgi:predicted DsbA family dithiol-disulfide isomerase